jgi:hypothetical protein
MKTRIRKCLSAIENRLRLPLLLGLGLLGLLCAGVLVADELQAALDLTAHEWGTVLPLSLGMTGRRCSGRH